jgi:hypothetical protein
MFASRQRLFMSLQSAGITFHVLKPPKYLHNIFCKNYKFNFVGKAHRYELAQSVVIMRKGFL